MEGCRQWVFAGSLTLKTLALALGTVLMPDGPVLAQARCTTLPSAGWTVSNPPADDRQKIIDAISSYAWALDDKNADMFAALFAVEASYEVCSGGGNIQIFRATNNAIKMRITQEFAKLEVLHTRHILSNTLLHIVPDRYGGILEVESKTTMLVTLQRAEGDRVVPEADYTADLRGTLVKDETDDWRFKSLTVYADTPEFKPMGR